jgi:small-conductance mechanosensitive channel
MKYFNLDSIFATSLIIVYIYTFYKSETEFDILHSIGIFCLALAVILFVLCGMPAQILFDEITGCCCGRIEQKKYYHYHWLWHVLSSLAPILSVQYIKSIEKNLNKDDINVLNDFENTYNVKLPTVSLLFGLVVNIIGNISGIMPVK